MRSAGNRLRSGGTTRGCRGALFALSVLATAVALFALPGPLPADSATASTRITEAGVRLQERRIGSCVNRHRRAHGIAALEPSAALTKAARHHARNMARYRFFDHTDPWGRGPDERVALFDERDWRAGENIGAGYRSVGAACAGWMRSAGHRENILNTDYEYVGGGYARGGPYGRYYVSVFGILDEEPRAEDGVVLTLSNSDDTTTLYLNGQVVGSIGYGGQQSFDLGELSDSDRIDVVVYNADGGYAWSIDAQRGGASVYRDQAGSVGEYGANGDDRSHPNQVVHSVQLDAYGNVLATYTAG